MELDHGMIPSDLERVKRRIVDFVHHLPSYFTLPISCRRHVPDRKTDERTASLRNIPVQALPFRIANIMLAKTVHNASSP